MMVISVAVPIFAIANPDNIRFYGNNTGGISRAYAYYNVNQTGDMLFIAETFVDYAVVPTDYTAKQAFNFELLDTDGITVLLSTPIINYGCKFDSIYQTAVQVTSLGLVNDTQYYLRITGNPAIFGTPVEDTTMVTLPLTAGNWFDQSVLKGTIFDMLANDIILIASDLQANDGVTTYLQLSQGQNYLTTVGGNIFLEGCPSLATYAPTAFLTSSSPSTYTEPSGTNGLETTGNINIDDQLGNNIGRGFTGLGRWIGGSTIPQAFAGMLGLVIGMVVFCVVIVQVTGHPTIGVVVGSMTFIVGGVLGLMPMAMAFVITLLIVILSVWFWLSRGYV
jgi:hypothetical protein